MCAALLSFFRQLSLRKTLHLLISRLHGAGHPGQFRMKLLLRFNSKIIYYLLKWARERDRERLKINGVGFHLFSAITKLLRQRNKLLRKIKGVSYALISITVTGGNVSRALLCKGTFCVHSYLFRCSYNELVPQICLKFWKKSTKSKSHLSLYDQFEKVHLEFQ